MHVPCVRPSGKDRSGPDRTDQFITCRFDHGFLNILSQLYYALEESQSLLISYQTNLLHYNIFIYYSPYVTYLSFKRKTIHNSKIKELDLVKSAGMQYAYELLHI